MKRESEVAYGRWLRGHHGVITTEQARSLGITESMLAGLVAKGRLLRTYRGVYVEMPARSDPSWTASAAALAAAGPEAALSHRSAAWAWGLLPRPPARVDVVVPAGSRTRLVGASVHRSAFPLAFRSCQGLRVTDPVGTIIGVAATAPGQLATVVDRGLAERLVHMSHLEAVTRRTASQPQRGVAVLRAHLLERGHLGAPHPSVLESRIIREVFGRYGLPPPQSEVTAGWFGQYRIDFAYPAILLAIEVDGYTWHWSKEHMEADYARRNHLRTLGWHVLVYTWKQVTEDSERTAAEILANYRRLAAA